MRSTREDGIGRDERELHAYHDGELRGIRRWVFERRLARSPALRAELEALARLTRSVQQLAATPPGVDVWDRIALRLPAIDEQRRAGDSRPERRGAEWLAAYARPLTAVGASVALALALFLGIMDDAVPAAPGMIRWLDTGGRGVVVLEDQDDATIVWLLDEPEDGISEGGSREAV